MEVWRWRPTARRNAQEMLTIKSDDVMGRVKTRRGDRQGRADHRGGRRSPSVLIKEQALGLTSRCNEQGESVRPAPTR